MKTNITEENLQDILLASVKGEAIGIFKAKILDLSRKSNQSAYDIFSSITYDKTKSGTVFHKMIKDLCLGHTSGTSEILTRYQQWCEQLHISANLIHFLEFLASQKRFYRFHPHIKVIYELKPYTTQWFNYGIGITAFGLFTSIVTFLNQPELWYALVDFFNTNGPHIIKFLLDYILLTENLAFISLFFKIIRFIFRLYWILQNKTITEEAKINELINLTISSALVIIAQTICFFNFGIQTPLVGYLFIASSLFELLWSAISYLSLNKPIMPAALGANPGYLETEIWKAAMAQYHEEQIFYDHKKDVSIYELIAFCMIAATTIISILFFPDLFILCVVCQFLCSWLKDLIIEYSEKQSAIRLSQKIEAIYETHQETTDQASIIALKLQLIRLRNKVNSQKTNNQNVSLPSNNMNVSLTPNNMI